MSFTKLYVGLSQPDNGTEWTYSNTAWEAMTKLELMPLLELHIESEFCSSVSSRCDIDANDIIAWSLRLQHPPQVFLVW